MPPDEPAASLPDRSALRDEDDFSHYFNATSRLSGEVAALRAEVEALKAERDRAVETRENANTVSVRVEGENQALRAENEALKAENARQYRALNGLWCSVSEAKGNEHLAHYPDLELAVEFALAQAQDELMAPAVASDETLLAKEADRG